MKAPWLDRMVSVLGTKEVPGPKANPLIVEMFAAAGSDIKSDEEAWCAAAMCWALEKEGYPSTNSLAARSYLRYGKRCKPQPGAIAIFPRGDSTWQGHVTIVRKVLGDTVLCVGGNQGNAVSEKPFKIAKALDFRWPNTVRNSGTLKAAGVAGLGILGAAYEPAKDLLYEAQGAFPTSKIVIIASLIVAAIGIGLVVSRRLGKMKAPGAIEEESDE